MSPCTGCGAKVQERPGSTTHDYLGASPGCYTLFTEVLAREYSDFRYASVHNLTVDTYAVQHPGIIEERRSIQSVAVHLVSLYFQLEKGYDSIQAARAKQQSVKQADHFVWLTPPAIETYSLTIADVHHAEDAAAHIKAVKAWARDVWAAWSAHHETVLKWANL